MSKFSKELRQIEAEMKRRAAERAAEEAEEEGDGGEGEESTEETRAQVAQVTQGGQQEEGTAEGENEEKDAEEGEPPLLSRRKLFGLFGVGALVAVGGGALVLREKGPGGAKLMEEYEKLAITDTFETREARHKFVLEQVVNGNTTKSSTTFETIKAKGAKGTTVEFQAARTPVRVGHNDDWMEIPMDGPHSAAAAEILGYTIPTQWMAAMILNQAIEGDKGEPVKPEKGKKPDAKKEDKSKRAARLVKYFDSHPIRTALGIKSWDEADPLGLKMTPAFIKKKNELLQAWLKENGVTADQFQAGYDKDIVYPIPGISYPAASEQRTVLGVKVPTVGVKKEGGQLDIFGGIQAAPGVIVKPVDLPLYFAQPPRRPTWLVQAFSGGKHEHTYFDYSHGVRFIKPGSLIVNGKSMTIEEFTNNEAYANEFGFQKTTVPKEPFTYSPKLHAYVQNKK